MKVENLKICTAWKCSTAAEPRIGLGEGCVLSLFYYANQTIHSVIQSNQTFTIRCWHRTIANVS